MLPSLNAGTSPFRLPTDEEVFITREAERAKRQEEKEKEKTLKIWEKMTTNSQNQLQRPKDTEFPLPEISEVPVVDFYPKKHKHIIAAALEIVDSRKKQPKQTRPENTREFVEQKKEMFRLEMSNRILKDEIKKIDERGLNKELAFERSEKGLEEDDKGFNDHMEENRKEMEKAVSRANQEVQENKLRDAEIKTLQQKISSITAEQSRNLDIIEALEKYKKFLEVLTPQDWLQQKNAREQAHDTEKGKWVEKELRMETAEAGPLSPEGEKAMRERLEGKFEELVAAGSIQTASEDPKEIYFDTPEELMTLFKDLEDKSLFLIELQQEMEHQVESMKAEQQQLSKKFEERKEALERNKANLEGNLTDLETRNLFMKKTLSQAESLGGSSETRAMLEEEIRKLYRDIGYTPEPAITSLDMLKAIESHVNEHINTVKQLPPGYLAEEEGKKEKERRMQALIEKQERDAEAAKHKTEQAHIRASAPVFHRVGKPVMTKTMAKREKKVQVVRVKEKTEDEWIQEFLEDEA